MRSHLLVRLLPCAALLLVACGDSSSNQTSTSGSTGGISTGSTGAGGGCAIFPNPAATACAALEAFKGPGLSKPFKSGVVTDVKPDGVTIDAGADGEVKLRWAGGDLTPIFAVGDAVTGIEEGFESEGYSGIESTKARAVVGYAGSNTSVSPPKPFTLTPQLTFGLAPECSWSGCVCPGMPVTTKRSSLVITVGGTPVTLKTGETGTVDGVVVHHGGATESSGDDNAPSCTIDFDNGVTFTLLQKL